MSFTVPPFRSSPTAFYEIPNAIEFHAVSSQYFMRTPAAGNQKTWSFSAWVRRGSLGSNGMFFARYDSGSSAHWAYINVNDVLYWQNYVGANQLELRTNAVFRDTSSWYHIVLVLDTTQATASDRAKIYVNGVQVTSFAAAIYPSQNADLKFNEADLTSIAGSSSGNHLDGCLADVHFIDGQALDADAFGEVDTNGKWHPKKYSGTYGTNGFHLTDASGDDQSSNCNDWTPVSSPTDTDDTPTNVYARLDPTVSTANNTYSNAGTRVSHSGIGGYSGIGSNALGSGKWYWEVPIVSGTQHSVGLLRAEDVTFASGPATAGIGSVKGYVWNISGSLVADGSVIGSASSYIAGDVISVAFDADAGSLWFRKNGGSWEGGGDPTIGTTPSISGIPADPMVPLWSAESGVGAHVADMLFTAGDFFDVAPTGFKAICTKNLPAPTIPDPAKHFDVALWTGTSAANTIYTETEPGLVWGKARDLAAYSHHWIDMVRGATKYLHSDLTQAEATRATGLTSFDADGFVLGADVGLNQSGGSYVGWAWGGMTSLSAPEIAALVSATDATITPTGVAVNVKAGMAIITYTGNGTAGATLPNPIGIAPDFCVYRSRSLGENCPVYVRQLGAPTALILNSANAATGASAYWNSTHPTDTLLTLGTDTGINSNGATYVLYVFTHVPGFSAFGSYTGNGSTDGPRIVLPFSQRWVLVKRTDSTGGWFIWDKDRSPTNVVDDFLQPNSSAAENVNNASAALDFLASGFKLRNTYSEENASGGTYIYAAFAEHPFGGGNVAPALAR